MSHFTSIRTHIVEREFLLKALEKVGHPAINYSLVELGILRDIELYDKRVSVVFAFPFPEFKPPFLL